MSPYIKEILIPILIDLGSKATYYLYFYVYSKPYTQNCVIIVNMAEKPISKYSTMMISINFASHDKCAISLN